MHFSWPCMNLLHSVLALNTTSWPWGLLAPSSSVPQIPVPPLSLQSPLWDRAGQRSFFGGVHLQDLPFLPFTGQRDCVRKKQQGHTMLPAPGSVIQGHGIHLSSAHPPRQGHSLRHESIPTQSHGCSLSSGHEARQKAKIGASFSASANATCLPTKSKETWMALGTWARCRGVQSGSVKAWYCPNHCPTAQIPSSGVKLRTPFLLTDSRATPAAHQSPPSATSTSQQCCPMVKPRPPSTHGSVSNRSGLSGSAAHVSPRLTSRPSSARMRKGLAVFGSRVTSAGDKRRSRSGQAAPGGAPGLCPPWQEEGWGKNWKDIFPLARPHLPLVLDCPRLSSALFLPYPGLSLWFLAKGTLIFS